MEETKDDDKVESQGNLSDYDVCDFCINCNTVLLHESSKISRIFRVVSTHRTLPLFSTTTVHDDEHDIKNKTEVGLLAAISEIFNLESVMNPSEKHSVCEKCGKLLEMAYNAILDFMELTRRGSKLQNKILRRNTQTSTSSLYANFEDKKRRLTCKNAKNEITTSKRSQRLAKNCKTSQVQSNLQNAKIKKNATDNNKPVGVKTDFPESRTSPTKKYKICYLCDKRFASDGLLKKHNRMFHNNDKNVNRKLRAATNQEEKSRKTVKELQLPTEKSSNSSLNDLPFYYCPVRDSDIEKSDSFQSQAENEEEEEIDKFDLVVKTEIEDIDDDDDEDATECELSMEKLKCKLCGEGNTSVSELKEHFSKQHPLVSILTVNDMHNIESNNDSKEELNYANDKDVVGETEKSTSMKAPGYNGRFIFNCNICNKRFIRHDHIKLHLRIHTGEKPFICKVEGCEKAFSDPRGLAYHEITHSSARPYCCKFCGMTFKRLHHLNDHERNHNDVPRRFNCQFCDKAFKHRKHLNSHLVVHQGTKEHQCNLCFKSFNRKDNLRQHVRNVHGAKTSTGAINEEEESGSLLSGKSKESTENRKDDSIKLLEKDGITSSTTQTVVFHTATGIITTGTIVTNNSGKDSTVQIKNEVNLEELTTASSSSPTSIVLPTAVNKSSSSNSTTGVTTNVTIPMAIAIADQPALDQIVYMHL